MTIRALVWSDDDQGSFDQLLTILQRIAPSTPATLTHGTTPRDSAFVAALGGHVTREQLPELLRRCEGENLQLAWGDDSAGPVLDVICELYDDHIEVAARPPLAEQVDRVLKSELEGAA